MNNIGIANTAIGFNALLNNTGGNFNTALGIDALLNNTIGADNTAIGSFAMHFNTTGVFNTALGDGALISNTTGFSNTAIGAEALERNTTGSDNIALGILAGYNSTGSNNIYIGSRGFRGEDRAIRIGELKHYRTFIAGISGTAVAGGVGVIVDTNGQLGTVVSSERFKDGIKPMDKASEAILALKPVTFRYKHELDPKGISQFGLVAEEVEKVNPDLVARDEQGKPYTVRYEAVNAMLLNEFLKEHRHVQEQDAIIARQQKQIDALNAGLQTVSTQVELNQRAPKTVSNNR
ncbi:MAG TPA: tail fiber domain-containing protein [Candidatus Udaeobacter sp.]